MKDYTTDTPEFSDRIKILETTDPGHADNVNVTTKQLLQNTLVNDRKLSEFAEVTDEDVENIISGPSGDVSEKKTPLTNLVNLIWTKWITPIKEGVAKKVDTSKIVKSTNITEDGFLMDGKTAAEEFAELNRKLVYGSQININDDLNNLINGSYYCTNVTDIVLSLKNKPPIDAGEMGIFWIPFTPNNRQGLQIAISKSGPKAYIHIRIKDVTLWSDWNPIHSIA